VTHRLSVYGTLAPGRANAHVLAGIAGTWRAAVARGTLHAEGWGAAAGYPGLVLSAEGAAVPGLVFSSDELGDHWARIDAFEGDGYRRVLGRVTLEDGTSVDAHVYELRREATPSVNDSG
jgi:gamma-glutamylcyclotransferase (GGCT)/AIG2-like uncharacterized protein YtfP